MSSAHPFLFYFTIIVNCIQSSKRVTTELLWMCINNAASFIITAVTLSKNFECRKNIDQPFCYDYKVEDNYSTYRRCYREIYELSSNWSAGVLALTE